MSKKDPAFIALKYKDFRLFWLGSFVSQLGSQMQTVAIAWQVYSLTHSPASLGFIGLSGFIPLLFFSLIGGVTTDKYDRKHLLIFCQIIQALLAAMLYLLTHSHLVTPLTIYIILALSAMVGSFSAPAKQSIIPNLVPKDVFINAVSLNTLQRQTGIIAGPTIAGFMIGFWGVQSVYFFNALSFLFLIMAIIPIFVPKHDESKRASMNLTSILEGLKFVKNSPIILSTMILDFLATFFGTANILMPIFALDILKVGAQGLGFLYAAPAVGGILAGLYFSAHHKIKNQGKIIALAITIYGLAIIGFGFSHMFLLSLIFLTIMGMGDMISTIVRGTLRQLLTPDHLRGRMTSVGMLFAQGGPQLGDTEAGLLANAVGAPLAVVAGGIGTLLITALVVKFTPSLFKYADEAVI